MIIELYKKMLFNYKLYPTYSICTIYNRVMDKKNNTLKHLNTNKNMLNNKTKNNSTTISAAKSLKKNSFENLNKFLSINSSNSSSGGNNEKFRRRSIKSNYDTGDISDNYEFLKDYPCVECQNLIDLDKICKDFKTMNKDLEWALCNNCSTKILPKLRVKYADIISYGNTGNTSTRKESLNSENNENYNCDESEVLYSPFHLKYNFYNSSFIESRLKLDLDYFKIKFNAIFWNSIWYFSIKKLPYDFISPYIGPCVSKNTDTAKKDSVNKDKGLSTSGKKNNNGQDKNKKSKKNILIKFYLF